MRILNIQRMSTEDGPGIRTTVFFKGCPLSCQWCHNPESLKTEIQKEWIKTSCISCLQCVTNCKQKALRFVDGDIITDKKLCSMCLECVLNCPANAMKQIGEDISPEALFKELIKDKAYFGKDGGITLSGGEVLMQADEALKLCTLLKDNNIKVALDTSGYAQFKVFDMFLPYIDLILYDLKIFDEKKHKLFCITGNKIILDNLIKLSEKKIPLWIRTPIIPEATDDLENIKAIAKFLKDNVIDFDRWELCAFNNLCDSKYTRLGQNWKYTLSDLVTKTKLYELQTAAKAIIPDKTINVTGLARLEETSNV